MILEFGLMENLVFESHLRNLYLLDMNSNSGCLFTCRYGAACKKGYQGIWYTYQVPWQKRQDEICKNI